MSLAEQMFEAGPLGGARKGIRARRIRGRVPPWLRSLAVDTSFITQVVQGIVLALGLALAGGNAFALWHSRRAWKRYEADLDAWRKAGRKKAKGGRGGDSRGAKPEAPEQQVRTSPAVVNIVLGLGIALIAIASLTFNWIQ